MYGQVREPWVYTSDSKIWVCTKFSYLLRVHTSESLFNWSLGSLSFSTQPSGGSHMSPELSGRLLAFSLPLRQEPAEAAGGDTSAQGSEPLAPESALVPRADLWASPNEFSKLCHTGAEGSSYTEPPFVLLLIWTVSLEWEPSVPL